jgi:hypothetical protein
LRASLAIVIADQSYPFVRNSQLLLQHNTHLTLFGFGSGASPPSLRACWASGLSGLDPYLFGPFGSLLFVVGFDFVPEVAGCRSFLHEDKFIFWSGFSTQLWSAS